MNNPQDNLSDTTVPAELLDWGSNMVHKTISGFAPEVPSYLTQTQIIMPHDDYEFTTIKQHIGLALNDLLFSDWTITFNESDVSWEAVYEDFDRKNEYGDGPFRLVVSINLFWDNRTNKHVIYVNPIQRNGETGVSDIFNEQLKKIFSVSV